MTDEISFQVPVLLSSVVRWQEESALVCLNSETIRPLMEGLYLENNRVVGDSLEVGSRFTNALAAITMRRISAGDLGRSIYE
jgi:hypothetical protein